ncbi:hypothetical protein MMU07_11925 [Aquiflexum sp. LQ15W]|uniref:hypothetical protein n=1 Tax=Cognataquiflexum nitidum TaxID=2922272 RepID=UPI001F142E7D|nr:hypothetical protein [Cognataquiflexum nitidum]MCH6200290.1 hypothetical protein [Cognataquiflexum nitidum]
MKINKNNLLLTLYSLSMMLVWGICFLDIEFSSSISVIIGTAFTVYTLYLVKNSNAYVNSAKPWVYLFIGPVIYLVSAAIQFIPLHPIFFLKSPILFGFIVFSFTYLIQNFSLKTHGAVILFVSYIYAFGLFPQFEAEAKMPPEKFNLTVSATENDS